jgi:hypothetical protein
VAGGNHTPIRGGARGRLRASWRLQFPQPSGELVVGLRQPRDDLLVAFGLHAPPLQRTLQEGYPIPHVLDELVQVNPSFTMYL